MDLSMSSGKYFPRSFTKEMPLAVRGKGIYLYDEEGKEYIDSCSGALISNLGHGVPEIVEAVTHQLETLEFAHPSRWRNTPVEEAAREVASLTPGNLNYCWFVSGGSEAIESALKLAVQYFVERDGKGSGKNEIIARWNSYHGSTIGTMGVAGSIPRRRIFSSLFREFPKIPAHYYYRRPECMSREEFGAWCAEALEREILRIGPEKVAAFIAEPIVGSTVCALVPDDLYWPRIREICDRYDVLLIADEVMTGFGRTGANFCVDHWKVVPDIIASAKGMAAGYVPTGGIFVKEEIVETLRKGSGGFTHGHTYNGNPLSGAAVSAVVAYMKRHDLVENARIQGELLEKELSRLEELPLVGEVRGKGLMWGVEIVKDKNTREPYSRKEKVVEQIARSCMEQGVVIYPGTGMVNGVDGDAFMVAPPLVVTSEEVRELAARIEKGLRRYLESR